MLAQLFGVEKIVVLKSIMNSASMGADEEMQYIGDPNAFLLAYATNAPSIDEPSAGYIFTWDMLGNEQLLPILNYLGAVSYTHLDVYKRQIQDLEEASLTD